MSERSGLSLRANVTSAVGPPNVEPESQDRNGLGCWARFGFRPGADRAGLKVTFDHIDLLLTGPNWTAIIYSCKYRYGKV